jgi:hypothetical protein
MDLFHVLPGAFPALADGIGDTPRLAHADANATLIVSNDHNRAERKAPATLDYLGRPGNVNNSLIQFVALIFAASSTSAT